MRTPPDLQGLATGDTGIAAAGPPGDSLRNRVVVHSGADRGVGASDGLTWMGALTWLPAPNWQIDSCLDHERRQGPFDRTNFEVFAGYLGKSTRFGLLYAYQNVRVIRDGFDLGKTAAAAKACAMVGVSRGVPLGAPASPTLNNPLSPLRLARNRWVNSSKGSWISGKGVRIRFFQL